MNFREGSLAALIDALPWLCRKVSSSSCSPAPGRTYRTCRTCRSGRSSRSTCCCTCPPSRIGTAGRTPRTHRRSNLRSRHCGRSRSGASVLRSRFQLPILH